MRYLDASVLVALAVEEPDSKIIQRYVATDAGALVVSEFGAAEAASGVSRLVRMGTLSAEQGASALEDLDAWRHGATELVEVTAGDLRMAHLLVRRFETKLRAPDALHVATAKRLGATLVTRDGGMGSAAGMIGVDAINPAAA